MKQTKKKALELKLATLRKLNSSELDQVQGGLAYDDGAEFCGSGSCKPSNCGATCDMQGGTSDGYAIRR